MPSRKDPTITIRLSGHEYIEWQITLQRLNKGKWRGRYSMTSWIADCVRERIKKLNYKRKAQFQEPTLPEQPSEMV